MSARPITHDWQPLFLEAFATMDVHPAARAAGVGLAYPYTVRKRDPEFATAWKAARDAKLRERRTCELCGAHFMHRRKSDRPGRFCSNACKHAHQRLAGEARAVEAFWAKVDKDGPIPLHASHLGACWIWTAGKDEMGYGMYRHTRSHRFSWQIALGSIPEGLCVLHECDTPACVRPDHLFLGTRDDNMRDRQAKRRQARGERSGRAVLTAAQVREARALRATGVIVREIAATFGVAESTMSHACTGRSWRHVA